MLRDAGLAKFTSPSSTADVHICSLRSPRATVGHDFETNAPLGHRTARCVRIGDERASRPARAARKRDGRTQATRRIYFGSVLRRDRCGRSSAGLAQLLLNRLQPVPESAIYGAGFFWRDSPRGDVAQYSALKHGDLV